MAVKVLCNYCGEEIISQGFVCEIKVTKIREIMLPPQSNKPQFIKQADVKNAHLCFNCWNKISQDFKIQL